MVRKRRKKVVKKQAAKRRKLITVPASKISKMNETQLLRAMGKAEYEKVYTAATWSRMQKRHDEILYGKKRAREMAKWHKQVGREARKRRIK